MQCPIESQENLELVLDYGKIAGRDAAAFEQHLETCVACREAVAGQRAVQSALDLWEAPAVSPSFNQRLYQRIERQGWRRWVELAVRPLLVWRGVPVAAAVCLLITAGIMLERPGAVMPPAPSATVETTQPDQVVNALDDMEMLGALDRSAL